MGRVDRVKKIVKFVVVFDVLLLIIYFFVNGLDFIDIIKKSTIVISFSLFIVFIINKLLWKIKLLNFIFDSPPNINGEWEGKIVNSKDKKPQKMKMKISQTYLEIYITVKAERGNSITWVGDIVKINGNDWKLMWTWHASNEVGEFSGTTILDILDENNLEGNYYTNSNIDGRGCTSGIFKAKKIK